MALPVSLRSMMDEMGAMGDEVTASLNRKTGDLVTVTDEELGIAEQDEDELEADWYPAWRFQAIESAKAVLESDDYLALPDQFEIHEYAIIERFGRSVDDPAVARELDRAIRGRGAFRCFKDAIHRHGIADDWYRFRDEAFERIAIDWLSAHEIPFTNDAADRRKKS